LGSGERHGTKGYFVQPTAFADVTMDMRIAKEEIFGPVASGRGHPLAEYVLCDAKDFFRRPAPDLLVPPGLASDITRVQRVGRRLRAGTLWVNQYVMLSHAAPFGGFKQSVSSVLSNRRKQNPCDPD
jgi:aldehyde dehydrogenase (NAD+)